VKKLLPVFLVCLLALLVTASLASADPAVIVRDSGVQCNVFDAEGTLWVAPCSWQLVTNGNNQSIRGQAILPSGAALPASAFHALTSDFGFAGCAREGDDCMVTLTPSGIFNFRSVR
jgi:hypothetical protein